MKKPWRISFSINGELPHVLTGSTIKELITTLATLIAELTKEEE